MILNGINSSLNKFYLAVGGLLFVPFLLNAQEKDSVQVYETISILQPHQKISNLNSRKLTTTEIAELSPYDMGSLLQFVSGITIKNYGGIGGMKTLSNRGLGGEHTQLVQDGFPIQNPQSGQTNFAHIQSDNIENISIENIGSSLLPVSAQIKGNSVQFSTFEQTFATDGMFLKSSATVGSFGQKEVFGGIKKSWGNQFVGFSGGGRWYEGNYPYHLDFDKNEHTYYRRNNALNEYHFSLGSGFKWKKNNVKHTLKISGNTFSIAQELPNAVILYNDFSKETLTTKNTHAGIHYQLKNENLTLQTFAYYGYQFLHYNDPNYLNLAGFLDNQYQTSSITAGFLLDYKIKKWDFAVGNDFGNDILWSNRELGNPKRKTNTSMLKTVYNWNYFSIEAGLFSQLFLDVNSDYIHRKDHFQLHPQVLLQSSPRLWKNGKISLGYQPSSRAASFNELYFSQVGNPSLEPEESSQLSATINYFQQIQRADFYINGSVYHNTVRNKILALPTKNLFIWSIQNIGKVDIYGAEFQLRSSFLLTKNWKINLQIGADYQKVMDVTNSQSVTYRHQIAYTPEISANALLSLYFKQIGVYFSSLYIGNRYSLNENIPENLVAAYWVSDIAMSYTFSWHSHNDLKLHLGVKNFTNTSYSFIRYYVMPEMNYFIKISYAFNPHSQTN